MYKGERSVMGDEIKIHSLLSRNSKALALIVTKKESRMVLDVSGERKVFIYSRELYQKHSFSSSVSFLFSLEDKKIENRKQSKRTRKIKKMDENDSC